MIREIVLDTETTGLDPLNGHRVVELGCLELLNHVPTGRTLQFFLDPERSMEPDATRVSGITDEMLVGKPKFADIVDEFLEFIGDAGLVIHNAAFDVAFLNAELQRVQRPPLLPERALCTLIMARRKYPGAPASLDALCKRFAIDLSVRVTHGALIDAQLLAQVYLEMCGGRQPGLVLAYDANAAAATALSGHRTPRPMPLPSLLTPEEEAAHAAFVADLGAEPLWRKYA